MTEIERLIALDKTFEETIAWLQAMPHSQGNEELVMALTHGRIIIRKVKERGL